MSAVTESLKNYIQEKGINIKNLAEKTGHSYDAFMASVGNLNSRDRTLRDDEFLDICEFLQVDPRMFSSRKDTWIMQNQSLKSIWQFWK